jgi:hypothetical protein
LVGSVTSHVACQSFSFFARKTTYS